MGTRALPDMYALSPRACGPRASGIHIRQSTRAHVITYTYFTSAIFCNCKTLIFAFKKNLLLKSYNFVPSSFFLCDNQLPTKNRKEQIFYSALNSTIKLQLLIRGYHLYKNQQEH